MKLFNNKYAIDKLEQFFFVSYVLATSSSKYNTIPQQFMSFTRGPNNIPTVKLHLMMTVELLASYIIFNLLERK